MIAESKRRIFPVTNGSNTANNAAIDCAQLSRRVAGVEATFSERSPQNVPHRRPCHGHPRTDLVHQPLACDAPPPRCTT